MNTRTILVGIIEKWTLHCIYSQKVYLKCRDNLLWKIIWYMQKSEALKIRRAYNLGKGGIRKHLLSENLLLTFDLMYQNCSVDIQTIHIRGEILSLLLLKKGILSMTSRYTRIFILLLVLKLSAMVAASAQSTDSTAVPEISREQSDFLKLKFGMFLHFNMATFVDLEWANGYEDPALFRPGKLDCLQWADAAVSAGMKYAVLTVKHTGAWCLWDSKYTTHDITSFKNYKNGRGDIVREFVDAFRSRGIKVGFYYCFPGDFSKPPWGSAVPAGQADLHALPHEAEGDYAGFIKKQLSELLSDYGPVDLLWIDQFTNKYTYPQWTEIYEHVKSLQPHCLVLGNNARDLMESDLISYEFPWKPELPPEGNILPAEVSDKLSPAWFWKTGDKPEAFRSAGEIVDLLKLCNARNANYLLNIPPDKLGLIPDLYIERLREIGMLINGE